MIIEKDMLNFNAMLMNFAPGVDIEVPGLVYPKKWIGKINMGS